MHLAAPVTRGNSSPSDLIGEVLQTKILSAQCHMILRPAESVTTVMYEDGGVPGYHIVRVDLATADVAVRCPESFRQQRFYAAHGVGARCEAVILGGISAVTVHRTFTTDAGQLILIPPSAIPTTVVTTAFVDRFATWTAEADVVVHATRRIGVVVGVRVQPISLADDISGRSVNTFAGMLWQFK